VGISLAIDAGMTVAELAGKLGLPIGEIRIVMVNGVRASLDHALAPDDRVAFFPAVGGG
jgi:sulfur carrier protein ThiS